MPSLIFHQLVRVGTNFQWHLFLTPALLCLAHIDFELQVPGPQQQLHLVYLFTVVVGIKWTSRGLFCLTFLSTVMTRTCSPVSWSCVSMILASPFVWLFRPVIHFLFDAFDFCHPLTSPLWWSTRRLLWLLNPHIWSIFSTCCLESLKTQCRPTCFIQGLQVFLVDKKLLSFVA